MTKPKRTPEEQKILDAIARRRGREWAEKNAALILELARALGELADKPSDAGSRPAEGDETRK